MLKEIEELIEQLKNEPKEIDKLYDKIKDAISKTGLRDDDSLINLIHEIINRAEDLYKNYSGLIISVIINEFIKSKEIILNTNINAGLLFYKLKNKKVKIKIIQGNKTGQEMTSGEINAQQIRGNNTGEKMNGGTITVTDFINGNKTGLEMNNGTINTEIITGDNTGQKMNGGTINSQGIIKGESTGFGMTGGTINTQEIIGPLTGMTMIGGTIKTEYLSGSTSTGSMMKGGRIIVTEQLRGTSTGFGMNDGLIIAKKIKDDINNKINGGLIISENLIVNKNFKEKGEFSDLIEQLKKLDTEKEYIKDKINKSQNKEEIVRLVEYLTNLKESKNYEKIIGYEEKFRKVGINDEKLRKIRWNKIKWNKLLNKIFINKYDKKLIEELEKGKFNKKIGNNFTSADLIIEAYQKGNNFKEYLTETKEGIKVLDNLTKEKISIYWWDNPKYRREIKIKEESTEIINVKVEQTDKLIKELRKDDLYYETELNKETNNQELINKIREKINNELKNIVYGIEQNKKIKQEQKSKIIQKKTKEITENYSKKTTIAMDNSIIETSYQINDTLTISDAKINKIIIKGEQVKKALFNEETKINILGNEITINGLLFEYETKKQDSEYLTKVIPQLRDHWIENKDKKNQIDNLLKTIKEVKAPERKLIMKIWNRNARHDFKDSGELYACVFKGGIWQNKFPNYLWDLRVTFLDTYINQLHKLRTFMLAGKNQTLIVHGTEGQESSVTTSVTATIINTLKDYAKKCGFKTILISTKEGNPAKNKFIKEIKEGIKGNYYTEEITPLIIKGTETTTAFEAFGADKPQKGMAEFIKIEI